MIDLVKSKNTTHALLFSDEVVETLSSGAAAYTKALQNNINVLYMRG